MNRAYSNYWWVYFVRGAFAILFGLTTLVLSLAAFATLVVFFGMFMIVDGLFSIMFSLSAARPVRSKPFLFFVGITGVVAGALMLFNPYISAITLVCLFALWSFFAGIMDMIRAMSMRSKKRKEGWYVLSGILSLIVVILLLTDPLSGSTHLGTIFGIYACMIGISLVSLAIKLRKKPSTNRLRSLKQEGEMIADPTM